MNVFRIPLFFHFKDLFFLIFMFSSLVSGTFSLPAEAQIFMEFTWKFEETFYEGLFFVPESTPATMTVRVLNSDGQMAALLLERADLQKDETNVFRLQCSSPKLLYGNESYAQHLPETFTAQSDVPGRVSNGKNEASYEINPVSPENIDAIVSKYLLPDSSRTKEI